eukprot:SAG31_NODE_5369_length_2581_cov_3.537873_2_plen_131_part_00
MWIAGVLGQKVAMEQQARKEAIAEAARAKKREELAAKGLEFAKIHEQKLARIKAAADEAQANADANAEVKERLVKEKQQRLLDRLAKQKEETIAINEERAALQAQRRKLKVEQERELERRKEVKVSQSSN